MFRDSKSKVEEEDINQKRALHQVNLGVELRRGQRSLSKSGQETSFLSIDMLRGGNIPFGLLLKRRV